MIVLVVQVNDHCDVLLDLPLPTPRDGLQSLQKI